MDKNYKNWYSGRRVYRESNFTTFEVETQTNFKKINNSNFIEFLKHQDERHL